MIAALDAAGLSARTELYRAYDGLEIDDALLERLGVRLFPTWELRDARRMFDARPIKMGEVGCALSHLMVWRMIVARGWRNTLILEDDAHVPAHASDEIEGLLRRAARLAPAWHLMYLDRIRIPGPPGRKRPAAEPELAKGIVRPDFSYCAHAYVVSQAGAARLLECRLEAALLAVDEFLPALYSRHPRPDVRRIFGTGRRLRALAAHPSLLSTYGDPSDTDASGYAPGGRAPRFRWAVGRPRVVRGKQTSIVSRDGAIRVPVPDNLQDVASRLVALARPSIEAFRAADAERVLYIEGLLFGLFRSGVLARDD